MLSFSSVNVFASSVSNIKAEVYFLDEDLSTAAEKFANKSDDEEATSLKQKYTVSSFSINKRFSLDGIQLAISYDELESNTTYIELAKQQFNNNNTVYFYGESIKLSSLQNLLGIETDNKVKQSSEKELEAVEEESWQIIGLNKKYPNRTYLREVKQFDNNKVLKTSLSSNKEIFIQEVLGIVDEQPFKDEGEVKTLGYSDDPIVDSKYNLSKTIYNGSKKTYSQNVFWILHQNLLSDNDANYDYFYVEHSVEQEFFNGAGILSSTSGGQGNLFDVVHQLPFSSADVLRDYGPKSNDGSTFTVGLPWAVSWEFTTQDSVSLDSTGSQTTGISKFTFKPRFYQAFMSNPLTVKPGTAWASKGSSVSVRFTYFLSFPIIKRASITIIINKTNENIGISSNTFPYEA